ncbi:MAG: DNA polymerase I [Defluviitaleaceae bacterium]|nr:DNA polymerase I [Defluviitaleaceae bacterium]
MPETLMLLDGMSLAFRAFYALPPLTASDGTHVNAILGFLNTFYKLYEEERPSYAAVAFDLPEPTFRHKLYAEYKGTREAMPAELRSQIPLLKEMIAALGVTIYESPGFEADDILGTLALKGAGAGLGVTIVTGDRDLLQTATDKVCVKIPRTRAGKTETEIYYAADVVEKLGVTPLQFVDVKALWGDTSDNIPGVPSIGEKTALKLIKEFGSVESCIENAAAVTPKKASENLIIYKEQALLSKTMAAIVTNAPVELELDKLGALDVYGEKAFGMVKRFGFKSLFGKFKDITPKQPSTESFTAKTITLTDDAAISEIVKKFAKLPQAAYIIVRGSGFEGISLAAPDTDEYFIQATFGDLDESRILSLFKEFFESNAKKLNWDAKSDMHILNDNGLALNNLDFDVMLAAYVLNKRTDKPGGAAELLALSQSYRAELTDFGMESLYYGIELPLVHVLSDMEKAGVGVNPLELQTYGGLLGKRIDAVTREIYNLTGEVFNINSTQQLSVVLFDRMGLEPEGKRMKTGAYSTAADTLERLSPQHPVIEQILEYRKLAKLKSTYADGLLLAMDKTTNRIHSTFNQNITATGRLSSTDPNLQNIPVRTELGRELRKAFVPSPGCVFVDADYSQIELRVLAHMSGDETFIDAFAHDKDIHRITAAEVFGVPLDEVNQDQRAAAKTVNFGIIYGQSAFSLANDLGLAVKEAESYINGYFNRYPSIKGFMEQTVKNAKSTGYTTTITGRRRHIPELASPNYNTRSFGERAAMNMPIQGSAADIIKMAMIRVHKRLSAEGLKSRLILQVHDELLVEAFENEAETAVKIVREEMEQAVKLSVPLKVDVNTGKNWFEAK